MRIRNLKIFGFRGFNEKREISFDEKLTLIYASNSYGKTSIVEAIEWLLYGSISKVNRALSQEEYKGCYKNVHLPQNENPKVRITFLENDNDLVLEAHLVPNDTIKKYINGNEELLWPFEKDLNKYPKPFVIQHDLKDLLLARPMERYKEIAKLLGLDQLSEIQQNIINLCTKPEEKLPREVKDHLDNITHFQDRINSISTLVEVQKAFKARSIDSVLMKTINASKIRIRQNYELDNISDSECINLLQQIKKEATEKIFKGSVKLKVLSERDKEANIEDMNLFNEIITNKFLEKYKSLTNIVLYLSTIENVEFFDKGMNLIQKDKSKCPFCGQTINREVLRHIEVHYNKLSDEKEKYNGVFKDQIQFKSDFKTFKQRLQQFQNRNIVQAENLKSNKEWLDKIEGLVKAKHDNRYNLFIDLLSKLSSTRETVISYLERLDQSLDKLNDSIDKAKPNIKIYSDFTSAYKEYISSIKGWNKFLVDHENDFSEIDSLLQAELEKLARVEDVSLLIDLLTNTDKLEKSFKLESILKSIKEDFKRKINKYIAAKISSSIDTELTQQVMQWYKLIKTSTDPETHFDGFDIPRKSSGDYKSRTIEIKAKSYDKSLISAVSSLSESKLNALGLCMSIANNIGKDTIFDFIIIDDPIQSWDSDHEIQFIEVIKKLIECDKQILLLSHNKNWIKQLRKSCRSINGIYWEITGCDKNGPILIEKPWENWKKRLADIDAIIKDNTADSEKISSAESELRYIFTELASLLAKKRVSKEVNPSSLNADKVRSILIECSIPKGIVDIVNSAFTTIDNSHHDSSGSASRNRLKKYHSYAFSLAQYLK